jgi:hypothetical protein
VVRPRAQPRRLGAWALKIQADRPTGTGIAAKLDELVGRFTVIGV